MVWPQGLPGIAALGSVTAAGLVLSLISYYYSLFPVRSMGRPHAWLQSFALTQGLCAAYFCVWAWLNTLRTSRFDAGTVSFAFPLAVSAWMLMYQPTSTLQLGVLRWQRWAAGLAPVLPAANYIVAIVLVMEAGSKTTLVAYYVIGASWWGIAAILGACLVHRHLLWLLEGSREHDHLAEAVEGMASERTEGSYA